MNSQPTTKYKQVPNDIEKNTLSSEASIERFNFSRLGKISRKKRLDLKNLIKKITRENIKVKISTRSWRRRTHTRCTAQGKRLTGKILQK